MKDGNVIKVKSMEFAIRIVEMSRYLSERKEEHVMSRQLLRSGTSIGANVYEGVYAQSRNDFISKLSIALKEASETQYWIELLWRTGYITEKEYESVQEDCVELLKVLTAIIKNTKEK